MSNLIQTSKVCLQSQRHIDKECVDLGSWHCGSEPHPSFNLFLLAWVGGCCAVYATVMKLTVLVSDQCKSPGMGFLTAAITKSPERLVKHLLKSIQAHLVPLHLAYGSDRRVDALLQMRFMHNEKMPKLWSTFLSYQTRSNSGQRWSRMNSWRRLDACPSIGSPLGCVLSPLLLKMHNGRETSKHY